MKAPVAVLLGVFVGAVAMAGGLVVEPALYFAVADRLTWQLGWPAAGQQRLESTLDTLYRRGDPLVGRDTTVLFGDSHLHGFPTALIGGPAVNYAIGGETAAHLALRVGAYQALRQAGRVVVLSGRNDLAQGRSPESVAEAVMRVVDQVPSSTPVYLLGIPSLRASEAARDATRSTNRLLAAACSGRTHCRFIATTGLDDPHGELDIRYALADGVHLNPAGYAYLAGLIRTALKP